MRRPIIILLAAGVTALSGLVSAPSQAAAVGGTIRVGTYPAMGTMELALFPGVCQSQAVNSTDNGIDSLALNVSSIRGTARVSWTYGGARAPRLIILFEAAGSCVRSSPVVLEAGSRGGINIGVPGDATWAVVEADVGATDINVSMVSV